MRADRPNIMYQYPQKCTGCGSGCGASSSVFTDHPISMTQDGERYYYLFNGLGSVTEVIDSNESVVNRYRYTPFGRSMVKNESVYNPYQYTGRRYDEERGNYYYRARIYDQRQSRFLSNDPAGQGANLYAYVGDNPVNRRDPSGKMIPAGGQGLGMRFVDGGGGEPWTTGCSGDYFYDTYQDCLDELANQYPASHSTHKKCQKKCFGKEMGYLYEESASSHVSGTAFDEDVFIDCMIDEGIAMVEDTLECIVKGLIASAIVCFLSVAGFVSCMWTGTKITLKHCIPSTTDILKSGISSTITCSYDALTAT